MRTSRRRGQKQNKKGRNEVNHRSKSRRGCLNLTRETRTDDVAADLLGPGHTHIYGKHSMSIFLGIDVAPLGTKTTSNDEQD